MLATMLTVTRAMDCSVLIVVTEGLSDSLTSASVGSSLFIAEDMKTCECITFCADVSKGFPESVGIELSRNIYRAI